MKATDCWQRALLAAGWLSRHQLLDGGWKGLAAPKVDAFYKASWSLMITGHAAAAHRSLNFVRDHFLTPEGDFLPRDNPWHSQVHYVYANAYLVIGAVLASRYDVAVPAARFLLSQQAPDHGGFYSRRVRPGETAEADTMSAGAAGLACLAGGQIEAARRVADYLAHMVRLQPAPDERFFVTLEADGKLGTQAYEGEEAWRRVIDCARGDQCWYAVGLPFAFLIQLAEATGRAEYRLLADWYFQFQQRCVDAWDGPSSGKAGWGCAMLYRITGETRYRSIALRVADRLAGCQQPAGYWLGVTPGQADAGDDHPALGYGQMDLTAEYTLWLALIASNLLARDAEEA